MAPNDSLASGTSEPIAITGPTASGKTAAALLLAKRLPIEIISVDSALVYKRLNIGSAKPSAAQQQAVRHHLIDIRDPNESYNAADFLHDATRLISEIRQRGHYPVFVGGTMLYLQCLIKGLDHMPPVAPHVRALVNERAAVEGWPALHQELQSLDPVSAARLAPLDAQRIGRALEVVLSTGQTLSSLQMGRTGGIAGILKEDRLISLEPENRHTLHQRIDVRLSDMIAQGFLDEAMSLLMDTRLDRQMPAMRCVGYRQAFDLLAELQMQGITFADLSADQQHAFITTWHAKGAAATRQLAKRQLTWLRAMKQRHIVAMEAPNAMQDVCDWACRRLATPT